MAKVIADKLDSLGALRLAIWLGNAVLLLADLRKVDQDWLHRLPSWRGCGFSRQAHATCTVLFTHLPPVAKGVTGKKRGTCEGWSERTILTNWKNCIALDGLCVIQAVVTIGRLPPNGNLHGYQRAITRWFKRESIAYHGCWEGPSPHMHILICSPVGGSFEERLNHFCRKTFSRFFPDSGTAPEELVCVDLRLKRGQRAAAFYCGKQKKKQGNQTVISKGREVCPWLHWLPYFHSQLPPSFKAAVEAIPPAPVGIQKRAIARKCNKSQRRHKRP